MTLIGISTTYAAELGAGALYYMANPSQAFYVRKLAYVVQSLRVAEELNRE